jgi:hypothetical protein
MGGFNIGGGPTGQAAPSASPGSSFLSGVVASVATVNINILTVQNLYTVPTGLKLVIEQVVLRDPTANAAIIEGSLGVTAPCNDYASFPAQASLSGARKYSIIYPSAIGESKAIEAGATFGIILSVAAGVAGTMTVEVIGRLVPA